MAATQGAVRVDSQGKYLDTTEVANPVPESGVAHREAVVIADPEIASNRTMVSTGGALSITSVAGNSEIAEGTGLLSKIHKFGRNDNVGTTFTPVTIGGIYRTPQVGSATTLRVKAGDANDTAGGSGAQEITLIGIDETGVDFTETLATAGASPSASTTTTVFRLFRAIVTKSGTYGNQTTGSHAADIVIENSAGTEDWMTIQYAGFPRGQSQCAVYTVPTGKLVFVENFYITTDSNKPVDILLMRRDNALQSSPPYDSVRVHSEFTGLQNPFFSNLITPLGPFQEYTDIGWMAKVAVGTADVSVEFEILLKDA